MLALITQLDGVNALLFHVEHCSNEAWEYRMRGVAGEWLDPVRVVGSFVVVPLVHPNDEVVVEWREGEMNLWKRAVPHEFGEATCQFIVKVSGVFSPNRLEDCEVMACGLVKNRPSAWKISLPSRRIENEVIRVQGVSYSKGVGQVLRQQGEFQCRSSIFQIMNAEPSQAALLEVASAFPSALPFVGACFVKSSGRLNDDEIAALMSEASTL